MTRKGCRSEFAVVNILFSDMRLSTSSLDMMSAFFSTFTKHTPSHPHTLTPSHTHLYGDELLLGEVFSQEDLPEVSSAKNCNISVILQPSQVGYHTSMGGIKYGAELNSVIVEMYQVTLSVVETALYYIILVGYYTVLYL